MEGLGLRGGTRVIGVEPVSQETCVNRRLRSTRRGGVPTQGFRRCPCGAARFLAALLAISGVFLSPGPQLSAAGAVEATLIVPGASLGPAVLGMTIKDLVAVLGPAVPGPAGTLAFPKWGVIATLQDGVAVRLSTTNPRFRTVDGAGVGTRPAEATQLVGDMNAVVTQSETETMVLYPFQGVGFVFRGGRAVAAFVVGRIALGPQAAPPAAPAAPPGLAPAPPGVPPAPRGPTTFLPSTSQGPIGSVSAPSLALRDLTDAVNAAGPLIRISGRIANTGSDSAGPVAVTVILRWLSGDESEKQVPVAARMSPGAEAPFTVTAFLASDLVIGYTVKIPGAAAPAEETRTVPPAAYTELAKLRIKVDVQLGGPDPTSRVRGVQALVSITDTKPIPPSWVKDVLVLIPPASNAPSGQGQQVHVTPGQTVTIVIPIAPTSVAVVTPGGATVTSSGSIAPLIGQPQILDVTLGS